MTVDYLEIKNEIPSLKEKEVRVVIQSASASTYSDTSHVRTLLNDSRFRPSRVLHIVQHGIGALRLPLPSSELVTKIFHDDGSVAYTSTRAKKSSGSAVLSHPKLGDLISTTYYWGPGRPPILKLLERQDDVDTVTVHGKCISRTTNFTTPDGSVFEWSYTCTKDTNGKKVNVIVLEEKETGKILAQLNRGEGTRMEGTSRCSAGNGGQLILDQDATSHMDKALIVATCLVMLKKEIDRRRCAQMAVMAGAASSGS
ncbi:hypothetical protein A1O7_06698 [Cladophialophora yegresii CBS 114405]|uniref:Uncharacterized protein n=1 Tax=Cladophialophora yegresii CBS 114405 TaxID=1182544 RepID=W9W400_9EURO|nr:uncharacterized protein A1O7_06698 [Cladophialophora yegresii CBS 114405]EXJ59266.1 hypothetical protein A1O7_06698 [Cladophialophora yegresii CBS 114405]